MNPVIQVVSVVLQVYSYVLLARALISWIPNLDPYNPIVQFLYQITEPVLEPIRKLVPPLLPPSRIQAGPPERAQPGPPPPPI